MSENCRSWVSVENISKKKRFTIMKLKVTKIIKCVKKMANLAYVWDESFENSIDIEEQVAKCIPC